MNQKNNEIENNTNCDFCSRKAYEKQGIAKNKKACVWYPLRPIIFGHFMVVTNRHVALFTDLTNTELVGIKELITETLSMFNKHSKVDGFNVLNNNGELGGQHIPHCHFHIFIRKSEEISPFDILSNKVDKQRLSQKEWLTRIQTIKSWVK